ncbi:MAG TPA: FliM/FliN family flagellar motor C-terminal domain-containing protein [Caulobacteraceae bacterium]
MTNGAEPWLPLASSLAEVVRAKAEEAVGLWNGRWFVRPTVRVGRLSVLNEWADQTSERGWGPLGRSLAFNCSDAGRRRLSHLALAAPAAASPLNEEDERLFGHLVERMLADLGESLETALGASPTPAATGIGRRGGLQLDLGEDGAPRLAAIAIPRRIAASYYRAVKPPASRPSKPLAKRSAALADTRVPLEVQLGQAELALNELGTLAVGDVLVLDRRIDQVLEVTPVGSPQPAGRARLVKSDTGMALAFE